jgi:predicted permease
MLAVVTTAVMFSVLDGVLLRELPLPHADRVIRLATQARAPGLIRSESFGDLQDWRLRLTSFEAIAGYWDGGVTRVVERASGPERLPVAVVTEGFARVLGVAPMLGRHFDAEHHLPGGPRVALLTYRYWRDEFASDTGVVGKSIRVADTSRLIIGVLPETAFSYPPGEPALWLPAAPVGGFATRRNSWIAAIGRLRPGVSIESAALEARTVSKTIASEHTPNNPGRLIYLERLQDDITQPVRPVLLLIATAVVCLLLIACGNIATLLFAQMHERAREVAVRTAIGGTPGRIIGELAVECLLLVSIGGVIGAALAPIVRDAMLAAYPGALPRAAEVMIDARVILVACAAMLLAAGTALVPLAWSALRVDNSRELHGSRSGHSREHRRVGSALAVGQLAFSLVLVFSSALLLRTVWRLAGIDAGFDATGVMGFSLTPPPARYDSASKREQLLNEMLLAVRNVPGVTQAEAVNYLPMPNRIIGYGTWYQRRDGPDTTRRQTQLRVVTPGYLRLLRVPLLTGRWTDDNDRPGAPNVMMINRALARTAFGDTDPVGRRIYVQGEEREVVGIVGDFRHWGFWQDPEPELYLPYRQFSWGFMSVTMRTNGDPAPVAAAVRRAVAGIDPSIPRPVFTQLTQKMADIKAPDHFRAALMTTLGVLALILSGIGLYGVVASGVAAQQRDIGIRMALGQNAVNARRDVVARSARLAASGMAIGAIGAIWTGRALSVFVHGLPAYDAISLSGVILVFALLTGVASYVPARRASRVSPMEAMRQ